MLRANKGFASQIYFHYTEDNVAYSEENFVKYVFFTLRWFETILSTFCISSPIMNMCMYMWGEGCCVIPLDIRNLDTTWRRDT